MFLCCADDVPLESKGNCGGTDDEELLGSQSRQANMDEERDDRMGGPYARPEGPANRIPYG